MLEISNVSEQQAEQSGGEPGSAGAGAAVPNSSDPLIETVMASARAAHSVDSPAIAPDHEAPKADDKTDDKAGEPKAEAVKAEIKRATPEIDVSKADAPKIEAAKADAPRMPRELLIMSPGERAWDGRERSRESRTTEAKPEDEAPAKGAGKRRFAAMAAMLALAVVAGAAGGALATIGLMHLTETAAARAPNTALETSVARIEADITALKAGLEQTSKASLSQLNKTSDRLDRIEKAQAEPAAKLAKLSEAVDRLRAVAPAAAKEITGSVTPPAGAQALPMPQASPAAAAPKTEVGRLPTVEGWVLRDVGRGSALIEGRTGLYEVYAGDPVPGLGRVDAIRRQDGRWVVVTSKGLIVAR